MSLYDDVYGLTYKTSAEQMQLVVNGIKQKVGQGFNDADELKQWAHDFHLDKLLYHNMGHTFLCVSHKGEIMLPKTFKNYYGNILFYDERVGNKMERIKWTPDSFEYYDKAYINGEQSDGIHKPLFYRNYCTPTGFFSEEKDAFNIAKPFPVFARETGRDTSHIYTYIDHVAGECAMWLLAWLRAKMLYPTVKTQVVPIIVSRTQGSGKTTFGEVICKGLFGKDNVLVTDQYDSQARFNADYADALIVCQEEKEEVDRRNPAGTLKSRATATTIRKEQKGVDPIYQESYTDFIMTTNKDVPIKFDGREDQRRFMIMEADEHFTRKESELADEVFTKLYGFDANFNKKGTPFVDDKELIEQFKHELFSRADIAAVPLRNFPKTAAYKRCFTLPRTNEATEIESIMRSLAPFIRESLLQGKLVEEYGDRQLTDIIQHPHALQYMPAYMDFVAYIAICRPLVFYEMGTMKPMAHSTVERGIYDCAPWLREEFGLTIVPDMDPLPGGFTHVAGRYASAATARFCLTEEITKKHEERIGVKSSYVKLQAFNGSSERVGERLRINNSWKPDKNGCFETVNEMKPGVTSLSDKSNNVQYLDTFLLESDEPTGIQKRMEEQRADQYKLLNGESAQIHAEELYKERLELAYTESMRLFEAGVVARIVYSGAKSYHLMIRVKDAPSNIDEYRWLHAYLCTIVSDKLNFDISTADPARLTRAPVEQQRITTAYGLVVLGTQKLVCENWNHVYNIGWRDAYAQWQQRPLKSYEQKNGRPIYPVKQEYQDALDAIIDSSFWTNDKYDGDRQRLFFPAYRLLRVLGYTHDMAWNDVLLPGIQKYKKPDEIGYWKSRQNSTLILSIDSDIDAYNNKYSESE